MADYLLFGVLRLARVSSPFEVIAADDIISGWMENMLDLHGAGTQRPGTGVAVRLSADHQSHQPA